MGWIIEDDNPSSQWVVEEDDQAGSPDPMLKQNTAAVERYFKNRGLAAGIRTTLEGGGATVGAAVGTMGGPAAPATIPLSTLGGYVAGRNLADVTDTWLGVKSPQGVVDEIKELPREFYEGAIAQVIGAGIGYGLGGVPAGRFFDKQKAIPGIADIPGALLRRAPGAQGLTVDESIEAIRKIPQQVKIKNPANWERAQKALQRDPRIPTKHFESRVSDLLRAEQAKDLPDGPTITILQTLKESLKKRRSATPFSETTPLSVLREDQRKLGLLSRVREGGPEKGVLKQLVESIHRDYDDVMTNAVSSKLGGSVAKDTQLVLDAVDASKREFASDEIRDIIERSISTGKHAADLSEDIRPGAIIDQITRKGPYAELINKSLPQEEIRGIANQIKNLKFPPLPPASGAVTGSSKANVAIAVGGAVGAAAGGPIGAGVGAVGAIEGIKGLQNFLMSPRGKEFLIQTRNWGINPENPLFQILALTAMSVSQGRTRDEKKRENLPSQYRMMGGP